MSRVYRRGSIDVAKENLPLAEAIEKGQVTIEFLYAPEDNPVVVMYYDLGNISVRDANNAFSGVYTAFPDNLVIGLPFSCCLDKVTKEQLIQIREDVDNMIKEKTENG